MEKTLSLIESNINKHSHFEEYYKIIELIKTNENINPDICIESCKALVEGISKTILFNLDKTKTIESIDKDDLPKLFKEAMRVLSNECDDIEGDFASRFSAIMQVIGEIRNKRGDISHGRMAPKFIFSSAKLASTIVNITDSMLEYILEHYFSVDFFNNKLIYDSKELQDYNKWLDDNVDFPIKKAIYSKILFENDYDEYETRYKDEYKPNLEIDPELKNGIIGIIEILKDRLNISLTDSNSLDKIVFEPQVEYELKLKNLVTTFNEVEFWTNEKNSLLEVFAHENDFEIKGLKEIIEKYIAFDDEPLRDDIAKIMINKPTLSERKKILLVMMEFIIDFAEDLKK